MAFNQMALPHPFYIIPICSIVTFLSSVACIASKSTASHSYNEVTGAGSAKTFIILKAEFPNERIALATYPYYLGLNATTLVLVASSITLVISIGFAALSAFVMLKRNPVKVSLHVSNFLAMRLIILSYRGTGNKRCCSFSLPMPRLH
jgi:hypothetical protein